MKLSDHVEHIRQLVDKSFRNRLGRMGITAELLLPVDNIPAEYHKDRNKMKDIRETFISETGTVREAYEKLVEELTFTLFNRIAALKVMEAHVLHPEIITRRAQHGGRSFAHFLWLEENPVARHEEQEGLVSFIEEQLSAMADDIPLFNPEHPYHLLPTAIELNNIILAFNHVDNDPQVEKDIWKSDDVLGWLYESYNNYKKAAHKASGDKTEYNKVSIQSQVYTPRWVVKFLVDNSLGKLYLEMYPDSTIKDKYKIANAPTSPSRERKPLTEIGMIDPATGSGNFILYGFDLFYDLYIDQIDNYGAEYERDKIPELIIQYNLHGIDLDDRAVQLAQLGLYIKAKRRNRSIKVEHFNIVSSDFFLPDYAEVEHLFINGEPLSEELKNIITGIWSDLQQAYRFGSLIRLEEKFNAHLKRLVEHENKSDNLFRSERMVDLDQFRDGFFLSLQKAVSHHSKKQGITFLNAKTSDAITFLQILSRKYDIAVANPPYTDSADFGPELKQFIDSNYKQPYKFNSNLYASFIKRCSELIHKKGKISLVHPPTFMYIKTFEDVRKYILEHLHIDIFVEWGYLGMFNPTARVDSAMYIFENETSTSHSTFIKLNDLYEGKRYGVFFEAYEDLLLQRKNDRVYTLNQSKLKIIEGWPFIYWISEGFREKFKEKAVDDKLNPRQGIATGNNDKCVRFWWEIKKEDISSEVKDKKRWKLYSKGGPYNKWHGNFWAIIDYSPDGYYFLLNNGNHLPSRNFYFKEGITYSASGSKGVSFRFLPQNHLFDVGGSCIFMGEFSNIYYSMAFLNSKLAFYIADCLNPTVNIQVGDIKRIPFVHPNEILEEKISALSSENVFYKKQLNEYRVIETNFEQCPIIIFPEVVLKDRVLAYMSYENAQLSKVLLNEAIINRLIFEVYDLSEVDRMQVETKIGKPVGDLPVMQEARKSFLDEAKINNKEVLEFTQNLDIVVFEEEKIKNIKSEFVSLYQSNNDLEEFCIRHQVNPINVWYWFKESKTFPPGRAHEIALEFIADACRTILMEDEDGIIPLVGLPGEPRLLDRLEQHSYKQGLNSAQFMQLDGLLGRPLNEYLEHHFFKNLSDHLNLFMYLPKTPFIWHLSSGEYQGFEAYIIIYKWTRDSLYKLKSQYLSKRQESLEFRLIQLKDSDSAQAQLEKELIPLQLQEIGNFTEKIEELIAEGYDPKLDDGVGKNIAPLQKKGLLRCEVLNSKQLEKYLNADW